MNATVLEEVKTAYADCKMSDFTTAAKIRNLDFRASEPVNAADAQEIARQAIGGYNAFKPELLALFPNDCEIVFAREGSVCIYVKPGTTRLPSQRKLRADEYDIENGVIRIWWD